MSIGGYLVPRGRGRWKSQREPELEMSPMEKLARDGINAMRPTKCEEPMYEGVDQYDPVLAAHCRLVDKKKS